MKFFRQSSSSLTKKKQLVLKTPTTTSTSWICVAVFESLYKSPFKNHNFVFSAHYFRLDFFLTDPNISFLLNILGSNKHCSLRRSHLFLYLHISTIKLRFLRLSILQIALLGHTLLINSWTFLATIFGARFSCLYPQTSIFWALLFETRQHTSILSLINLLSFVAWGQTAYFHTLTYAL